MVALGVPAHGAGVLDGDDEPLSLDAPHKLLEMDGSGDLQQEPLLSTTTDASSMAVSMSADEAERDNDDDSDEGNGDSDDADDEGSDDDVLCIVPSSSSSSDESEDDVENQQPRNPDERSSTDAEARDSHEPDANPPAAMPPASSRFSLISIPRRVRDSVFSRKPAHETVAATPKQIEEEDPQESAQPSILPGTNAASTISPEREGGVEAPSPSPSPNYTGVTLASLTSFTSLTQSLSTRSITEETPRAVAVTSDNVETFKTFWDEKLRATMDRVAHRANAADTGAAVYERERDQQLDVFHLLLKLYAHQDVIEELYASYEANAAEFEFYIPQLCTFLLHGNYVKQHQLECFLMSRSGESLVFAHRLFWFLKSFCGDARGYQSEYLSVTSSPEEENADLLVAIQQRGGVPAVLMEQGLNIEEVAEPGPNLLLRRASSFDIDAAAEATITVRQLSNAEDDEAFSAFLKRKRDVVLYEAMPEEGNDQQIALYKATPEFVAELTDLADRLIPLPLSKRNEELRRGLALVSETFLPSNVIYLPIGNSYHRVKGIQIDECFTFSTKERVPYFMCVEVIDYSVSVNDEAKKLRKSLIGRRRSRKFGIKLGFKKNRKPVATKSKSKDLQTTQELLDGLHDEDLRELPAELLYEEESKTDTEPSAGRSTFKYDVKDLSVLALTPHEGPSDADISARFDAEEEARDGDDEKDTCEDSTDAEQKQRMGQWGLSRTRRRNQAVRPNAPKTTRKFDSFYSSWFARKQKTLEAEVLSSEVVESTSEDCVLATPYPRKAASTYQETPVEEDAKPEPVERLEPVPEPKVTVSASRVIDSSDDDLPKRRGRDMSVSLDFTDGDAWKVNFDLEDVLTDAEPEVTADVDTPEITPEVPSSEHSEEEEHDGEDDEEEGEEEKPIIVFRERWSEKEERIRKESPLGSHPGWRLLPVIVKSNDDLRQEQFAAQLIDQCDRIFKGYSLPLRLRPYNVIATSAKTGLIEAVPNTVSLDSLKRNDPHYKTLLAFYERLFGSDSVEFRQARRNFVESLAAYSIVCYVFQIKDRHNGNILLDTDGHVIHIDFGFLLTNSPGSNLNFERAPFKLTDEFVELMGGPRSATFRYFRSLCIRAYLALRRNMDKIVLLVEMMLVGNADLPCFAGGKKAVIEGLKERLKPGARTSESQLFVNQLIDRSINNWRTRWYDKYQRAWVGIL